eukprot:2029143-Prymnesium_polylepis.1
MLVFGGIRVNQPFELIAPCGHCRVTSGWAAPCPASAARRPPTSRGASRAPNAPRACAGSRACGRRGCGSRG